MTTLANVEAPARPRLVTRPLLVRFVSVIAIMGGPAFASNNPVTGNIVGNGNIPILSGNNVQIPVQIPVDICGNAVGLLGFANASCVGGAAALLDDSGN